MSSVRSFSTAVSASASTEEDAGWTRVGPTRHSGWGTPTARPAPAPAPTTRAGFSFASAATAAALDGTAMPPRAPSSRMISTGPPLPKPAGSWGAARPTGAVAAAKEANKTPNIQSMKDFPALGGGGARPRPAAVSAPAPTWSRTIAEASARVDAEAAAEEAEAAFAAALRSREAERAAVTQRRSRLANIGSRCFDDTPAACDTYPDEEDADAAGYYREEAVRPEDAEFAADAEADGEFNPSLVPTRRAGDKSDW